MTHDWPLLALLGVALRSSRSKRCRDRSSLKRMLANLTVGSRLPAIYGMPEFAEASGLLFYDAYFIDLCRRAAGHVDKILKGTKPADIQVEQPLFLEMVVNLRSAKSLGLAIPQSVLPRANRVIE